MQSIQQKNIYYYSKTFVFQQIKLRLCRNRFKRGRSAEEKENRVKTEETEETEEVEEEIKIKEAENTDK